MKVITKIVEYLPDTQQIVIKICRLHSHKTIDQHRTFSAPQTHQSKPGVLLKTPKCAPHQ